MVAETTVISVTLYIYVCKFTWYYDTEIGRFITEDPIQDDLNWYVYCGNDPINFMDFAGESTGPITMAKEYTLTSNRIGGKKARIANKLGNIAEKSATNYAKKQKYYEGNKLKTWDNAADAKRHMEWNSRMVRSIGYSEAQIVSNNHEIVALREKGLIVQESGSYVLTYMYQAYLMDLRNNAIGRNLVLNEQLKDLTYDELFEYALEKNILITDANTAYDYFGITDCADTLNRIQVLWNVETDTLSVWSFKENCFKYTIELGK